MTAKIGFLVSSLVGFLFFILMGVFVATNSPMVLAVFSGIITVISIFMIVISGIQWWDDTRKGRD